MVAHELLSILRARGVSLSVKDGKLITDSPKGGITPDLGAEIKAHRAALLRELQPKPAVFEVVKIFPLPDPLIRLVMAASGNHLNFIGHLPNGVISNLGDYVLACAAMYASGIDTERQLRELWAARKISSS